MYQVPVVLEPREMLDLVAALKRMRVAWTFPAFGIHPVAVRIDADALKIFHSEHEESIPPIGAMWSDCHANVDQVGRSKRARSARLLPKCFRLDADVHPLRASLGQLSPVLAFT